MKTVGERTHDRRPHDDDPEEEGFGNSQGYEGVGDARRRRRRKSAGRRRRRVTAGRAFSLAVLVPLLLATMMTLTMTLTRTAAWVSCPAPIFGHHQCCATKRAARTWSCRPDVDEGPCTRTRNHHDYCWMRSSPVLRGTDAEFSFFLLDPRCDDCIQTLRQAPFNEVDQEERGGGQLKKQRGLRHQSNAGRAPARSTRRSTVLHDNENTRRNLLHFGSRSLLLPLLLLMTGLPTRADANDEVASEESTNKVRRDEITTMSRDEQQWKAVLSDLQYYVLRQKGTEPRYYSVLVDETRPGIYQCAGCHTPLFNSASKFESGTGWPSFGDKLPGVQVESSSFLPPLAARALGIGSELVCRTCRGHIGEVFYDGHSFRGTIADHTGLRYCIDGAALVFYPDNTSKNNLEGAQPVRGDQPSDYAAQL